MPILCFYTRLYDGSQCGLVRWRQSLDLSRMSPDDASAFRTRTGRIRDQGRVGGRQSQSFVAKVMKVAAKANGGPLT